MIRLPTLMLLVIVAACGAERSSINGRSVVADSGVEPWPPLVSTSDGGRRVADAATLAAFISASAEVTCVTLESSDASGFEPSPEFWARVRSVVERHGLELETYESLQQALATAEHAPTRDAIYREAMKVCEARLSPSGLSRRVLSSSSGVEALEDSAEATLADDYVEVSVALGCAALASADFDRESILLSKGFDENRYIEEGWRLRGQRRVFERISRRLGQCAKEP